MHVLSVPPLSFFLNKSKVIVNAYRHTTRYSKYLFRGSKSIDC